MPKDTIKERLYQILLECGRPLTERQLTEKYILKYPDYSKNYTSTKTPPEKKIRGTIQSVLRQNSSHPKIIVNTSVSPYTYEAIR